MHFIALLETAKYCDRIGNRRLLDKHLLKTALQCSVFFYVLTILIQCSCADAMQFTTRECRLEHVASIHRSFSFAGADQRMQFVDEQDDLPFLFRQVIEYRLEALLEFTAKLGARNQRTQVK